MLTKLQSVGKKVSSGDSECAILDSSYLFIRCISTYQTFQSSQNLLELTEYKINELVHRMLEEEQNTKVLLDLMPSEGESQGKKKKKKKGPTLEIDSVQGDIVVKKVAEGAAEEQDEEDTKKKKAVR